MYISSISSFAASWLFLCLIIPFHGAERSDWIPLDRKINDDVHHQFRSMQPESVSFKEQFQYNVPKSPQYNAYRSNQHNSVLPKNSYSEGNVKQNVAKSIPKYLEDVYKPYYYSEFVGNQETTKDKSATLEQRYEETDEEIDEEIMKKMNVLDKLLSEDTDANDVELKNTVEDAIIAETNISEETKRVVRQVRRQRPGFFWTLARLTFEAFNDTRSAIQQISNLISQNIEPDPTTRSPVSSHPLMVTDARTVAPSNDQSTVSSDMANANATTTMTTTTSRPFRLTPTGLQTLIRRNLRGLIRLFNIEWQDALNQSEINVREFQKNLGNQVGSFLQDNPNAF
ncbi:uncharacterized protein LOC105428318 [Pogonomyrmex barbatus]|uniref:Uncharacterized protein LOC105428318 n=1 Tax=Pogonomyrmex barbatus TaxID=144034 RepID=A0A6I9W9F0_9HYME|nr:uncharacterized protein LOC105428318 [Pogonomyrmex barbatus]XP_011638869.1 uncharacterized protein LOC105428318 [Pogonomyrmex barbatus]XP_011638870.1 uncharacterized protein LOC105428318 [Pogonomyrmex barbatus]XP_025074343.1 uncharacterized protein LOC105428318 [Pogonomyrmex barbatus]